MKQSKKFWTAWPLKMGPIRCPETSVRNYRGADKPLARPGRKQSRKHVRRRARFQQHRDASSHQVFFFLQGKAPKEIHAILRETLTCFLPGRATDLSAPLYHSTLRKCPKWRWLHLHRGGILTSRLLQLCKYATKGYQSEFSVAKQKDVIWGFGSEVAETALFCGLLRSE